MKLNKILNLKLKTCKFATHRNFSLKRKTSEFRVFQSFMSLTVTTTPTTTIIIICHAPCHRDQLQLQIQDDLVSSTPAIEIRGTLQCSE
jgi:hypothetical protein